MTTQDESTADGAVEEAPIHVIIGWTAYQRGADGRWVQLDDDGFAWSLQSDNVYAALDEVARLTKAVETAIDRLTSTQDHDLDRIHNGLRVLREAISKKEI